MTFVWVGTITPAPLVFAVFRHTFHNPYNNEEGSSDRFDGSRAVSCICQICCLLFKLLFVFIVPEASVHLTAYGWHLELRGDVYMLKFYFL